MTEPSPITSSPTLGSSTTRALLRLSVVMPRNVAELSLAFIFAIFGSCLTIFKTWKSLHQGEQVYSDIVAGYIVWSDDFKSGDYRAAFLFLLSAFVFGLVGVLLCRSISRVRRVRMFEKLSTRNAEVCRRLFLHADFVLAPIVCILALFLVRGVFPTKEAYVAGIVYATFLLFRFRATESVSLAPLPLLFALNCATTLIVAVVCVFSFSNGTAGSSLLGLTSNRIQQVAQFAFILSALICFILPKVGGVIIRRANDFLQVGTPLLLLQYWKTVYDTPDAGRIVVLPNAVGQAFLFVIIAFLMGDALCVALRTRGGPMRRTLSSGGWNWNSLLRTGTVISIASYFFYASSPYSVAVFDDFHLGETLIPWDQVMGFGQRLYTDFVSVQGLLGLGFGATNWLFYSDTAATYCSASFVMLVLVNGVTTAALCRSIGRGWALLLAPVLYTMLDRVLIIPLVFLILSSRFAGKSYLRWLVICVGVSVLHLLWTTSTGAAFIFAGAPLFVAALVAGYQKGEFQFWLREKPWHTVLCAVGIILLGYFSGVFTLIIGALSFMRENGSTNTVAYGLIGGSGLQPTWFPRWFGSQIKNDIVWEGVRVGGWLLGMFALLWAAFRMWIMFSRGTSVRPRAFWPLLVITLGGTLFVVSLIPYSLGRVDAYSLSRSGAVAMLMLGFFIPIASAIAIRDLGVRLIPYIVVGASFGLRLGFASAPFEGFTERVTSVVAIPKDTVKVDGPAVGLPNLGNWYVPASKLDEINRLKISLSRYLINSSETYYDLTERSAFYYFLHKKVPSPYSADYLAANEPIQLRVIERLEREKPPLVWIGPAMQFDAAPPSFRSYRIFRWLMEQDYRYEAIDGNQFLVRPDRLLNPDKREDIQAMAKAFYKATLDKQPIAWGRNLERMRNRFESVVQLIEPGVPPPNRAGFVPEKNSWLEFRSGVPTISFPLQQFPFSADRTNRPDFLLLSMRRRGPETDRLKVQISWDELLSDSENKSEGYTFDIIPGEPLLVALGSDPRWQRSKGLGQLQIKILHETPGSKWSVDKAELLRLVK